jgi:7-cyano-7-deazaguanine synthase
MNKEKVVVILSGGLDSTTLLYDILNQGYEVYAICFDYGQKHKKELMFARETCKRLDVNYKRINLDCLNELAPSALTDKDWDIPEGDYKENVMKQTVVPNRNMVFISLATSYAIGLGATKIYYGAHLGDHTIYPDCRFEFVSAMQQVLKLCDWREISLIAPYLLINKSDIIQIGNKLQVDYSITWSCYKGHIKACGKCGTCIERLEAFKQDGLKDPIEYE